MAYSLGSFTGQNDPSQLMQQPGQAMINPGMAQLQQNAPVAMAGTANLGNTLQQLQQQPQLPAQATLPYPMIGAPPQVSPQQALAMALMQGGKNG